MNTETAKSKHEDETTPVTKVGIVRLNAVNTVIEARISPARRPLEQAGRSGVIEDRGAGRLDLAHRSDKELLVTVTAGAFEAREDIRRELVVDAGFDLPGTRHLSRSLPIEPGELVPP